MNTHFTPEFFAGNRARLRQLLNSDIPIVVTGNGLMQRGADESFRFHQDSNFWYLTGLDAPDLVLVMTTREAYLLVPGRSAERAAFDGEHDAAAYSARSGIATVVPAKEGWRRTQRDLQDTVATLLAPPSHLKQHGLYTLPFRRNLIAKLKRLRPGLQLQDIRMDLAACRSLKQPQELAALQQAIDITCDTLSSVTTKASLQAMRYEYELEAAISQGFRSQGADGHAFAPIVGAGKHGTTLHYLDNNGPLAPQDLIVLDVGASVEHYSADITRTVAKQSFSSRQLAVFEAVCAVQDYALSLLKPGVNLFDYEEQVTSRMGEHLHGLGLLDAPTKQAIRRYYPHGTSHFLGLDTHDVGNYRQPLASGMVLTCEPGIYIPEEGIGVRIEDDVLITNTGCKVLSAACPRLLTPVQ